MHSQLPGKITISPAVWPGKQLKAQPGDLDVFVATGLGLSGPFLIRPWDDPLTSNPGQYYGVQPRTGHPLYDAPLNTASGGTVYFDDGASEADLQALCRVLGIHSREKRYAAFLAESSDSPRDRYLVQLKIVTRFGLRYTFQALDDQEYADFPEQPLSIGELFAEFVRDQEQAWGTGMSRELSGCMGGDGDWAKESLAFGCLVENDYHGVYRLWSRAWLVTK